MVAALVMVLIVGGGLTAQIAAEGGSATFPWVIRSTANPDASALDMTPWKAEQLFLVLACVVFNLIGAGLTLTLVFWFLNWQVKKVKAESRLEAAAPRPVEET
ncbi:MAG: hypothetical protein HXY41_12020 [Chloroflexi bacterium]|nr:hypothetical protein [Chloroflexota bacterium]